MTTQNKSPEVAIIGAGITGMSTAWHLSQRGVSVIVLDKVGVGAGMTAIQPGGIRTQWAHKDTFELAREAQDFYENFVERTGAIKDPELVHCGYAFVASTPETLVALEETVKAQNEQGINSRMLSVEELAEMVPGINEEIVLGGSFNESDGYLNSPGAPVSGFAYGAEKAGAQIVTAGVNSIERVEDMWQLNLSNGDTITVPKVVVAAGAESAKLVAPLGVDLPLVPEPRYLFYSNVISERLIEPLVIFQDEHFAVKHLADGSVLASDLALPPAADEVDEASMRREMVAKANKLVETLEYVKFPVMVTGYYDVTPDQQLLLGSVNELPGITLACGLNGRGMMLAPAVGRVVADTVVNGNDDAVPVSMRTGRFTDGTAGKREQMVI